MSKRITEQLLMRPPLLAANPRAVEYAVGLVGYAADVGHEEVPDVQLLGDGAIWMEWKCGRRGFALELTVGMKVRPHIHVEGTTTRPTSSTSRRLRRRSPASSPG
jgi:hypothetical protein